MKAVIGSLRKESYLWRANSGKDQTKCISEVRNQFPSPMRFAEAAVCSVIPAFYAQWLTLETNTIRRSWALTQRRWQGYTTKKRMFMSTSRTKSPLVFPETGFIPVGGWNLPLPNEFHRLKWKRAMRRFKGALNGMNEWLNEMEPHLGNDDLKERAAATLRSVALSFIQRKVQKLAFHARHLCLPSSNWNGATTLSSPNQMKDREWSSLWTSLRLLPEASINNTFLVVPLERRPSSTEKGRPRFWPSFVEFCPSLLLIRFALQAPD